MLAAYRQLDDEVLAYAPSDGFADYRCKLASYFSGVAAEGAGAAIEADDIIVTVGGSEALVFAIAAACDPGDDIAVCEPYYTNYTGFAHLLGVGVVPITTFAADGFRVDVDRVSKALDSGARALVLPSPGNPTGVVLSREQLAEISEICWQRGVMFVCDEVYREFVYDGPAGSRAPSVLSLAGPSDHLAVVDSVSKRYSACGARIGCLVTRNRELRAAALRFAQARLSPPTVDQYAAMAAIDTPRAYFDDVVREYRHRRDVLVASLRLIGVECTSPQGAFYLVAPLPVEDADDFCRFLLEDFALDGETVMLAPASGFYATPGLGKREVRIAYVLDADRLQRAVTILGAALDAYAER